MKNIFLYGLIGVICFIAVIFIVLIIQQPHIVSSPEGEQILASLKQKCERLNKHASDDMVYTELYLVKSRLQFPLTAEFKDLTWGIEDTDASTVSCGGHVICKNAYGVPSQAAFGAVFKANISGADSLLSFQMR